MLVELYVKKKIWLFGRSNVAFKEAHLNFDQDLNPKEVGRIIQKTLDSLENEVDLELDQRFRKEAA